MSVITFGPGMRLGERFEIESIASSGGMGIVFRGRDRQSGDPVALKVMRETESSEAEERFLREAQVMTDCRHPNLASYITHGRTPSGALFLAMEWIEGENLAERLQRQPLTINEVLTLARVVAEALAVLHERGIVHRDIKPSNLLLRNNDVAQATVLDFGLACGGAASWRVTLTGEVVGTLHYLAPEQARGDRRITASTDVYALGCVLYECLTGTPPFDGNHAGVLLARILIEEAPPLRQARPDLPVALERLVRCMLSRDIDIRPANGAALVDMLATLELPPLVADVTMPQPAMRFGSEHPLLSVVVARTSQPDIRRTDHVATQIHARLAPAAGAGDRDEAEPGRPGEGTQRDAPLVQQLLELAAELAWLPDGTLCVMPSRSLGHVLEQSDLAAHVALHIRAHWPHAVIAIGTGSCALEGQRWRSSDAFVRACALLDQPSGAVWLDRNSAALLAERFETRSAANDAWELVAQTSVDAPRLIGTKVAPMVGREQELQLLELAVSGCINEETSRAVLVLGGAGMGKTRLRRELMSRLRARGDEIELFSLGGELFEQGASYRMLAHALRRWCGMTSAMSEAEQEARLAERVGRHLAPAVRESVVTAFRHLFAVAFAADAPLRLRPARPEPLPLDDRIMSAWEELLRAETQVRPLVLVVDDLHYGDAGTIRLLGATLRMLDDRRLLIVAFARPGIKELFPHLWEDRQLHEMRLGELGRRACERLIRTVLGQGQSEAENARLYQQSGGNPRYLEELLLHRLAHDATAANVVAAGQSSGGAGEGEHENTGAPMSVAPMALVALLQRSFLQLAPGLRRILRCASIFGPCFWRGGIRELVGDAFDPSQDPQQGLTQLAERGWIMAQPQSRYPGEIQYTFRQPLLPVAIDALLGEEERSTGHALAAAFCQRMGETDDLVMAVHLRHGGRLVEAALRYASAAAQALASGFPRAAHRHASAALSCNTVGSIVAHLRSIDAWALVRTHALPRALAVASRSQRLAAPGSTDWYRALTAKLIAGLTLGRQALVTHTVNELRAAIPAGNRSSAAVEAGDWALVVHSLNQQPEGVSAPLPSLQLDELSGGLLPLVIGWQHLLHRGDPWSKHVASAAVCTTYATAERPHFHAAAQILHARNAVTLGERDQSIATFQSALLTLEQRRETLLALASRAYFALALVETTTAQEHVPAAAEMIAPLLRVGDTPNLFTALAYLVHADERRSVGDLDGAERAARHGMALGDAMPLVRLYGYTALAEVCYARGDVATVRALTRQGLLLAAGRDSGTLCEIRLYLIGARAELQLGDEAAAKTLLDAAYRRLQTWASAIDTEDRRVRFLEAVPLHAQVTALRASLAA